MEKERGKKSEEEDLKHYSDKGGHLERSNYWKLMRQIGEPPMRLISIPIEESWRSRRSMRRTPFDGRR